MRTAWEPETRSSSAHCQNCGAALRGRFCHDCGQEQHARIQPLGVLVRDGLDAGYFLLLALAVAGLRAARIIG